MTLLGAYPVQPEVLVGQCLAERIPYLVEGESLFGGPERESIGRAVKNRAVFIRTLSQQSSPVRDHAVFGPSFLELEIQIIVRSPRVSVAGSVSGARREGQELARLVADAVRAEPVDGTIDTVVISTFEFGRDPDDRFRWSITVRLNMCVNQYRVFVGSSAALASCNADIFSELPRGRSQLNRVGRHTVTVEAGQLPTIVLPDEWGTPDITSDAGGTVSLVCTFEHLGQQFSVWQGDTAGANTQVLTVL